MTQQLVSSGVFAEDRKHKASLCSRLKTISDKPTSSGHDGTTCLLTIITTPGLSNKTPVPLFTVISELTEIYNYCIQLAESSSFPALIFKFQCSTGSCQVGAAPFPHVVAFILVPRFSFHHHDC